MLVSLKVCKNRTGSEGGRSHPLGCHRHLMMSLAFDLLPAMQFQPLNISLHVLSYLLGIQFGS
jgi:hypothetical protein